MDAGYEELVINTEKKFGKIVLGPQDYNIPLGEKYKSKNNKTIKAYFLTGFRNEVITKKILSDTANKIVLLYGKAHYKGILENLQKADSTYHEIK